MTRGHREHETLEQVFLDFISYSRGPLPEELLGDIEVPVLIGWGDQDPWEPIELGRAYAAFDSVEVIPVICFRLRVGCRGVRGLWVVDRIVDVIP